LGLFVVLLSVTLCVNYLFVVSHEKGMIDGVPAFNNKEQIAGIECCMLLVKME